MLSDVNVSGECLCNSIMPISDRYLVYEHCAPKTALGKVRPTDQAI